MIGQSSDKLESYMRDGCFEGKNVLITGATGGIGSIITNSLLNLGANVIGLVRKEKKVIEKFKKRLDKGMSYEVCEIDNPIQINRAFQSAAKKFKGKIDILILSHGIFKVGMLTETNIDGFDNTLNINIRSCFHLISICTPFLKLTKGNVVAISSIEGKLPLKDSFLNCLSKVIR